MNKFLQIIIWVGLVVVIASILGFAHKNQKEMLLREPVVNIDYETNNRFVSEEDILNQLINPNDSLKKRINSFNLLEIEKRINNNPSVKSSQVFRTIDGDLIVNIKQRRPIARIYSKGENYYMDENGLLMSTSSKYTARVLIVNGLLKEPFSKRYTFNYAHLHDSLTTKTLLDDIYKISKYIDESDFWKAQIEQVYVNKDLDLELIPKVGNHKIVFGGVNNIDSKFSKLMIFYEKGLKKTGWNEYSEINLKYKNQVVCTKIYN